MITEQQNKMYEAMLNANPECKKLVDAYFKKFPEFLIKIMNGTRSLNFNDGIFSMEIKDTSVECNNVDDGRLTISLFPIASENVKKIKYCNEHITKSKFYDLFYDENLPKFDRLIGFINCRGHHYNFHVVEKKDGYYLVSANISLSPDDEEFEIKESLVNLTDLVDDKHSFML